MDHRLKRLFGNTVVFTAGKFISKLLVFLMMPLYTACLSEAQYSTADLITQFANLLIPLACLGISEGIFRSAAALGMQAVLLTSDCCDPLYRRACRVSMGTVFQVPWAFLPEDYMPKLKEMGFALTDSKANFLFAASSRIPGGELYRKLKARGILVRHFDTPALTDATPVLENVVTVSDDRMTRDIKFKHYDVKIATEVFLSFFVKILI